MSNEYLNNKTFEAVILAFQSFKKQKTRCEMVLQDLRETHDRRQKKYNDDKKLDELKVQEACYKEVCDSYKAYQEQLAYAFYLLAENITNYYRFNGIDLDDAVQEGC